VDTLADFPHAGEHTVAEAEADTAHHQHCDIVAFASESTVAAAVVAVGRPHIAGEDTMAELAHEDGHVHSSHVLPGREPGAARMPEFPRPWCAHYIGVSEMGPEHRMHLGSDNWAHHEGDIAAAAAGTHLEQAWEIGYEPGHMPVKMNCLDCEQTPFHYRPVHHQSPLVVSSCPETESHYRN